MNEKKLLLMKKELIEECSPNYFYSARIVNTINRVFDKYMYDKRMK